MKKDDAIVETARHEELLRTGDATPPSIACISRRMRYRTA
jgi:hypothetical protein